LSEIVYNTRSLKEAQKNIINSLDHILNHYLACENPAADKFVAEVERKMQAMNTEFNKEVLSILGSNIGKDNQLCFPSYKKGEETSEQTIQGYCWIE
jgi:hypothetical protein